MVRKVRLALLNDQSDALFPTPAERLAPDQKFRITGKSLDAIQFLKSVARAKPFVGGPSSPRRSTIITSVPDDAKALEQDHIGGRLPTVTW
jgi:hypothetical protein